MINKYFFLAFTLVCILSAPLGCDYFGFTKTKEIADNPIKFEGKEVKVKGTVENAFRIPLTETVVYTVKDDSGSIMVVGTGVKPNNGDSVKVKGRKSVV